VQFYFCEFLGVSLSTATPAVNQELGVQFKVVKKQTPSGGSGSVSRFKLTHYPSGDHVAIVWGLLNVMFFPPSALDSIL
jgi:hypothetical protein